MRKDTTKSGIRATPAGKHGTNGGADALGISEKLLPPSPRLELLDVGDAGTRSDVLRGYEDDGSAQRAKILDERDKALVDRYALQAIASKLMPGEAVSKCHFSIIGSVAKLLYIPSSDTAALANVETCHSVWMCAVCSAKISHERQEELRLAIAAAEALGYKVAFCTYTFAHYKGDDLNANIDAMLAARRDMLSGRAAKDLKATYSTIGCIRCLEVTHGMEFGFHPHMHELVFFDVSAERAAARAYADEYTSLAHEFGVNLDGLYEVAFNRAVAAKIDAYGKELGARWMAVAAKRGLSMNGHGFQIDSADARVAEYISKWGHEPGEKTRQAWDNGEWDEAAEMTQWHRKRGAKDHYTPFDLLRFAGDGDEEAAKLFQVYAHAFKGRLQLFFPGALRKRLGMPPKTKTDQEIIESHELDKQEVAAIASNLFYKHIRQKKHARPKILNVVRRARGDLVQVADYMTLNFDAVLDTSGPDLPIFRHVDDWPGGWSGG